MPQGKGTYGSEVGRPPKKNSPMGYNPFKMKAGKASGYDNSPMKKNYGQFGVGTSEMPTKPTPNKILSRTLMNQAMKLTGGGDAREGIAESQEEENSGTMMESEMDGAQALNPAGEVGPAPNNAATRQAAATAAAQQKSGGKGGNVAKHGPESHVKSNRGGLFGGMVGTLGGAGASAKPGLPPEVQAFLDKKKGLRDSFMGKALSNIGRV